MASLLGKHTVEFINSMSNLVASAYDYDEALVRQNQKQEDVDKLRAIIENSDSIVPKCLHDKQLLVYLCVTDNVDESAKLITKYYEIRKKAPEFCSNRNIESPEVKQCLENQNYIILPVTPDNCSVLYQSFISYKPSDFVYDEAVKTYFMMAECCLMNQGPRDGVIILIDIKGTGFGHLSRPSMRSIKLAMKIVEECSPFNIKAIHILNVVPFIGLLISIAKPLMRSELFEKVQFHSSSMDYEKFYEECVPRSCLPSDYGGDLASVSELHEKTCNAMNRLSEYYKLEERASTLEFGVYDWKESLDVTHNCKMDNE